MKYQTPSGQLVDAPAYVRYLRECAARWRAQPTTSALPQERERMRRENEEQAARVEAKADAIEKGEGDAPPRDE
jgi:hypothetical protein